VAFVPVLLALGRSGDRPTALRTGLAAGLVTNVPAFYWLVGTIHVFGGFPRWLAAAFYGVLSLYSALQLVLLALGFRRVGFGPVGLGVPLLWVSLEFLFPNLFPWRMANTQLEVPALLQVGEWTGPFGLSFVILWVDSALALAILEGPARARGALGGSFAAAALVAALGALRLGAVDRAMSEAPEVRVGIVQGNLSIAEKGDVRYLESNIATYAKLSRIVSDQSDVVIWPESVITDPLPRGERALRPGVMAALGLSRPLLAGALTYSGSPANPEYYNSVVLFDAEGGIRGLSDKQILMPFGEYLPLATWFPGLKRLSPMTGDFRAGSGVVPLDVPGAGRFAPLNCYEDLSASITRDAVRKGGEVLFSVANDAWFGATAAPYQHEALALWRAVESRRFLVRVTNTGVSDVIDAAGRVRLRLPIFEPAQAVASVRRMDLDTFHTRRGDLFAWLVVAATAVLLVAGRVGGRPGGL
jgi:apolipoprotein N-acyltransferase